MNHTILNIDKTNWKPVKFGDVVAEPKEICKDIVAEGIEHVVGLEHVDTGDLHLRKSATIEESTTFSKKFRKGDVLFGRRRAYLKKAAQADFDGICSGDITVFRVKKELSSALLPFIVNNDKFFDYAVKHSAGGLSPRVKFKDLANYEFLLPPKAEQARLAELLWAIDEVVEKDKLVLAKIKRSDVCQLKHYFYDDQKSDRIKLKNIVSLKKGKKPNTLNETGEGLPYCTAKYLRTNEIESVVPESTISKAFVIDDTDIIILWDGSNAGEMLRGKKGVLASTMCKLVLKDKSFNMDFVFQFLRFRSNDIRRATVGSAIPHVDPGMIENIEIPVLEMKNQKSIVALFNNILSNINLLDSKISASQSLQKSLINEIF